MKNIPATEYEQISLPGGGTGFRKFLDAGESDCFRAEAAGLAAIAATGTVSTPTVLRAGPTELVTEFIPVGPATREGWYALGRDLARMHSAPQPCFGFDADNFCGASPQVNSRCENGYEFFAQHRLIYQGQLARDAGLLEPDELRQLETLSARLPDLLPHQSPALLHGDLWSGNVLFDREGAGWLIDPACYWGWPEADLAMTTLFGRFDGAFYSAYAGHGQVDSGWEGRGPIYNLYHLLNHLNLFGATYLPPVQATLARYGA